MFPGHRRQSPVLHYLNNQLFFVPSWSGVTIFTFGGPSTILQPHSALGDGTETSLQWEMLRHYTHFCYQYIIINASKYSNLFHSLKRKKKGNCNISASSLYFFSVKIRKVGVSVHHQAIPYGIITWPIQRHWTSLWRWTNDHYISAPACFLNPNLFSWTWDCWLKTLFSVSLSSSNLLKMQAFPRLSFLSLLLSLVILSVTRVSTFTAIQFILKSVSISAHFSEFQAHISSHELNIFISQMVTCLLHTSCCDRCSGTICTSRKSNWFNTVWGHEGLKSQASSCSWGISV